MGKSQLVSLFADTGARFKAKQNPCNSCGPRTNPKNYSNNVIHMIV